MKTKTEPKTCREAAARFREWARKAGAQSRIRLEGHAEILDMFGDAPVPVALLEKFDFDFPR